MSMAAARNGIHVRQPACYIVRLAPWHSDRNLEKRST